MRRLPVRGFFDSEEWSRCGREKRFNQSRSTCHMVDLSVNSVLRRKISQMDL